MGWKRKRKEEHCHLRRREKGGQGEEGRSQGPGLASESFQLSLMDHPQDGNKEETGLDIPPVYHG